MRENASKLTNFFHNLNIRIICLWFRFLRKTFNYYQDTSVIPTGDYCYNFDDERNKTNTQPGSHYIKNCPYYKHMYDGINTGCSYLGFVGFEPCLWDQCKMCSENIESDEEEIDVEEIKFYCKDLEMNPAFADAVIKITKENEKSIQNRSKT
jgi:hypothetical protein